MFLNQSHTSAKNAAISDFPMSDKIHYQALGEYPSKRHKVDSRRVSTSRYLLEDSTVAREIEIRRRRQEYDQFGEVRKE